MKKTGNCDQCHERHELNNTFASTFHRHFKYRNLQIRIHGHLQNAEGQVHLDMFLCKKCINNVMRAMKSGDNWE